MFRKNAVVIFQDAKYIYEGKNPDGSILIRRLGSKSPDALIAAPANEVREFLREGRTEIDPVLRKLNG